MAFSEHRCSFKWKAFREWSVVLEHMFGRVLIPELEAKIRQNAPRIKHRDDREAFEELTGLSIDAMITTERLNEFRRRYSHIRVYHACRPDNVSTYYEKGLFLRNKNVQIERFRSIFLSGKFPELTEKMLQQSVKELASHSDDDGELCLGIDDKWLIEQCGVVPHDIGRE